MFKYFLSRAIYFFSRVPGIRNWCPSANCQPFQSLPRRRHFFNLDANAPHLVTNVDKCWGRCGSGLLTVAAPAMHTKYARQQDAVCPPHPELLLFFGVPLNAVASLLKLHSHILSPGITQGKVETHLNNGCKGCYKDKRGGVFIHLFYSLIPTASKDSPTSLP